MSIVLRKKRKNKKYMLIFILMLLLLTITLSFFRKSINKKEISGLQQIDYMNSGGEYVNPASYITITPINSSQNVIGTTYNIKLKFTNEDFKNHEYKIECNVKGKGSLIDITDKITTISIELEEEGLNTVTIIIKDNNTDICKWINDVYYIEPYESQFLEELNEKGYSTHMGYPWYADDPEQITLLKSMGVTYIRDDIRWNIIEKEDGTYYYTKSDKWINKAYENDISIIGILGYGSTTFMGSDSKISTEEELQHFLKFVNDFATRYKGKINYYEYWNEPNTILNTNEEVYWYVRTVKELYPLLKSIDSNIKLTIGAMRTDGAASNTFKTSNEIFDMFYENNLDKYSDNFSIHVYDYRKDQLNNIYRRLIEEHVNLFSDDGGFQEYLVTEHGASTFKANGGATEEKQASVLITQSIINDEYNVETDISYTFRNRTATEENSETIARYNFGTISQDYTPKPAYYTMKNYYENTNGAEYIGTVNLADGLETHVYDKDGKTKIITWSTNTNNTISIPYENFTASDMYGNAIENTDGTLKIISSPVYLDNVSTKYFYEAISNTALQKYAEFEEKFSTELESIDGLQEQINKLKNYMSSIANNKTETQEKSIEMMHEHFYLGTMILDSFNKDKLNVEYVKVSSMLDMLNDIGNSYEDLLTVSATSREAYYKETEKLLNKAETTINNNSDLNILYPSKILDFAKELHDKSKYIIGLEEENDIKTGLIVSNSLHAYYLADWANDFANIYVNKYIKENPVTVSYSNTDEFTNKDLTVTLNIGSDSKVINNEGKNTYTFNKNGTFTFEYERRGQAFKQEITITNIDKETPVISGIVNGKIYTNSVKPVITDKNLAKVEVLFNGTSIQFNSGNTLKEEGIYNITATDKAGNNTSIEMYIVKKGEDSYIVDGEHILNVRQETKVEQFAKKFNLSTEYTIKRNNNNLLNTDTIATGDILQLKNGSEYTIIVAGDINRDGKVTTYDLSTFRRYILNLREFDKLEEMAADINVDKQELGVKDYTRMRIEILGEY